MAGDAALLRVQTAISQKQQSASAAKSTPTSTSNGYSTVQNLMSSLDHLTLDNGSLPASSTSSSSAANGYSAVQNIMSSLDNLTIGTGNTTDALAAKSGMNALQSVDAVMATPAVNVTA